MSNQPSDEIEQVEETVEQVVSLLPRTMQTLGQMRVADALQSAKPKTEAPATEEKDEA